MSGGHLKTFEDHFSQISVVGPQCCWRIKNKPDLSTGYVRISFSFNHEWAHRAFYKQLVGPIPHKMQVDHLCRNRWCVNPGHMALVDNATNAQRGMTGWARGAQFRARTHCAKGHPYNKDNTRLVPKRNGRACRACCNESARRSTQRRRALAKLRTLEMGARDGY